MYVNKYVFINVKRCTIYIGKQEIQNLKYKYDCNICCIYKIISVYANTWIEKIETYTLNC